jgi:geranylgeranyl diphosphate synthase type II
MSVLASVEPVPLAVNLIRQLTTAAGSPAGMVGGQVADLEAQRETANAESVRFVHENKTAALIRAAVTMGGTAASATDKQIQALARFGEKIGLAFQVVDDILDVTGTAHSLGKSAGKDEAQKKVTYPAVFGLEESRRRAHQFSDSAVEALDALGAKAERLRELAALIINRET